MVNAVHHHLLGHLWFCLFFAKNQYLARQLRVVHIESGKEWRGAQNQVLMTVKGQMDQGCQTSLICVQGSELDKRAREHSIPTYNADFRVGLFLIDWIRLLALLAYLRPMVVHIHCSHSHNFAVLAARFLGVPAVILTRRRDKPISGLLGSLKYRIGYDKAIAVSTCVKHRLVEAGVPCDRVEIIHDAVNGEFLASSHDCEQFRQHWLLKPSDKVILVSGVIDRKKGQDVLLRAMPTVLESHPNAKVVFAGKNCSGEMVSTLTKELGLEGHVVCTGFNEDMAAVIACADIVCAPSLEEGLGVSILEAMTMGKPVVASRTGGIADSVVDGSTGYLVTPGESSELADRLICMLDRPDVAKSMGEQGRARALEIFQASRMVDKTMAVYTEILEQKAAIQTSGHPEAANE